MTIKQLPEIISGRIQPSSSKVDASLIDLAPVGNSLIATTEGLKVDLSSYATSASVTSAIASALLSGTVDLSGYATKTELQDGLTETNNSIPAIVDGKVNTAIASLINGAPTTFDTLKEIADWIETDGVDTTTLAASIATKLNTSDFTTFQTKITGDITSLTSTKADKTVTDALDTRLDALEATPLATKTELDTKLTIPTSKDKSTVTTPVVNSLPLYTMGNGGEYVLCTPEKWFLINGYYVPGYSAATIGV